jgi:hypothetical protein
MGHTNLNCAERGKAKGMKKKKKNRAATKTGLTC